MRATAGLDTTWLQRRKGRAAAATHRSVCCGGRRAALRPAGWRLALAPAAVALLFLWGGLSPALAGLPVSTELEKYMIVATRAGTDRLKDSNSHLGANTYMLSGPLTPPDQVGLDTRAQFQTGVGSAPRHIWTNVDELRTCDAGPGLSDQLINIQVAGTSWTAGRIFEGIDWTGNAALTSPTGQFNFSNTWLLANLGIVTAKTATPFGAASNSRYFANQFVPNANCSTNTNNGVAMGAGAGAWVTSNPTAMTTLRLQLDNWEAFIRDLAPETTLTCAAFPENTALTVIQVDQYDTNNDGIAVIDIRSTSTVQAHSC